MRYRGLVLAGMVLAGCDMLPQSQPVATAPAVAPERADAFVVLVERLNCQVDPVDHEPVHTAGFTDAEISVIGEQLVTEGRARLTDTGDLVLQTEDCL